MTPETALNLRVEFIELSNDVGRAIRDFAGDSHDLTHDECYDALNRMRALCDRAEGMVRTTHKLRTAVQYESQAATGPGYEAVDDNGRPRAGNPGCAEVRR